MVDPYAVQVSPIYDSTSDTTRPAAPELAKILTSLMVKKPIKPVAHQWEGSTAILSNILRYGPWRRTLEGKGYVIASFRPKCRNKIETSRREYSKSSELVA